METLNPTHEKQILMWLCTQTFWRTASEEASSPLVTESTISDKDMPIRTINTDIKLRKVFLKWVCVPLTVVDFSNANLLSSQTQTKKAKLADFLERSSPRQGKISKVSFWTPYKECSFLQAPVNMISMQTWPLDLKTNVNWKRPLL